MSPFSFGEVSKEEVETNVSYHESIVSAGLKIVEAYPPRSLPRFVELLDAIRGGGSPYALYPGLTRKPWFDRDEYSLTKRVADTFERAYSPIRTELDAFLNCQNRRTHFQPYRYRKRSRGDPASLVKNVWSQLLLVDRKTFIEENTKYFPVTTSVIASIQDIMAPFGQAEILALRGGGSIEPHRDITNRQLTFHLGLIIPPQCAIAVGGQTRTWDEGKSLFFDHSFTHEAWNHSDRSRFVLVVNVTHPELTDIENEALERLERAIEKAGPRPPGR